MSRPSVIPVRLLVPKFSNLKCLCSSRKYNFSPLPEGLLKVTPELWSNLFQTLTSDTIQGNVAGMWQFLLYVSKTVKIEPENLYFAYL